MTDVERGLQKAATFFAIWFVIVGLIAVGFAMPKGRSRPRGDNAPATARKKQESALEWYYNPRNPHGAWRFIIQP